MINNNNHEQKTKRAKLRHLDLLKSQIDSGGFNSLQGEAIKLALFNDNKDNFDQFISLLDERDMLVIDHLYYS